MDKKVGFVLGINGQTGSYMAELLLSKGYTVFGLVRRQSTEKFDNIAHILDKITILHGDLTDQTSLIDALNVAQPDEVYNFAAQSHVHTSWEQPELTANITGVGVLRLLEAIRKYNPKIKFIQASSSEQFGRVLETPQTEKTPFNPVSPYACAKCLTPQTKIYTNYGIKTIRQIKVGDKVWTHTGTLQPVTKVFYRKYTGKLFNISICDGRNNKLKQTNFQLTCTPEHPILTDRGWIQAQNLLNTDKVAIIAGTCKYGKKQIPATRYFCSDACHAKFSWKYDLGSLKFIFYPIRHIKSYQRNKNKLDNYVYNIEVKKDNSYIANGIVVHNCFAYSTVRTYRFSYNIFACNAISFNHESERRGQEFVTRKITHGIAKIVLGLDNKITLGNLDAKRDWSHARDIVVGMYAIMQNEKPDDFILCSGKTHSIKEFLDEAFKVVGINDWSKYIIIDKKFLRPAEVNLLQGDYTKAKTILGWQPTISFKDLVREMVENDINLLKVNKYG